MKPKGKRTPTLQTQLQRVTAKAKEFAELIAWRVSTAQVKTASPSRAQKKIQVRVSWTDPDGSHGLGYYSLHTSSAESMVKGNTSGPSVLEFISTVFRTQQWADECARANASNSHELTPRSDYTDALKVELGKTAVLHANSHTHELRRQVEKILKDCVKDGRHEKARKIRLRESAKDHMKSALNYALNNGVKDDEIREMLKLALVKHTMES